ncbi:MAG TPA: metalloregulator ArsR/SmtB family transcription factor [Planctomycetota bacterium]|nr:metalloregulator ArsR/SmtB family transcription factor [Planctomycetota bacterium]
MKEATAFFRLLGDEARLRILRLLEKERLNVSELTSILGIAQPGVSRHLRLLKEGGLVQEERDRGWTYYGLAASPAAPGRAWDLLRREIHGLEAKGDDARLQEILRHRKEEFTHERGLVPGKSWAAWARALGHLLPPVRVADLGCGEGYLALEAARWAKQVIAVDVSERALEGAKALAAQRSIKNLHVRKGDIEDLPLEDGSVDVALLSQALHHAKDPARAIREAARVLSAGGTLLLLDLKSHKEEWVKKLGDKWLGFDEESLRKMMKEAGLRELQFEIGSSKRGDPFQVIVASGKKPK